MIGLLLPAIIEGFAFSAAGFAGNKAAKAIWEGVASDPERAKLLSIAFTKLIQSSLRLLGQDVEVDGVFGSETENAVRVYQYGRPLPADGIVGEKTLAAIADDLSRIKVK